MLAANPFQPKDSEENPVWVTGLGCISASGISPESFWQTCLTGQTRIPKGGIALVDEKTVQEIDTYLKDSFLGQSLSSVEEPLRRSKPLLFPLFAIHQAMTQAGWSGLEEDDAIIFSTTTGQISLFEEEIMSFTQGKLTTREFLRTFRLERMNTSLENIRKCLGFRGRTQLLSTACAASTHAVALGSLWIKHGFAKRVLVGGSEVLSKLTTEGFRSLQLLSEAPATPFDVERKGINLGEGAAFLCLERDPKGTKLGKISGVGITNDAYHMTSPQPEGNGSLRAMKQALRASGLQASDIEWVHAHGTGSPHNDDAEANAIHSLFQDQEVFTSSTKGVHGHTLATAGALEIVLCLKAMEHETILPTAGLKTPDPKLALHHAHAPTHRALRHVLKNTLGFGGSNGALVLSGEHP